MTKTAIKIIEANQNRLPWLHARMNDFSWMVLAGSYIKRSKDYGIDPLQAMKDYNDAMSAQKR